MGDSLCERSGMEARPRIADEVTESSEMLYPYSKLWILRHVYCGLIPSTIAALMEKHLLAQLNTSI